MIRRGREGSSDPIILRASRKYGFYLSVKVPTGRFVVAFGGNYNGTFRHYSRWAT